MVLTKSHRKVQC